jgi:hypothetical protein
MQRTKLRATLIWALLLPLIFVAFISVLAQSRKAHVRFVNTVRPSVRMYQRGFH